MLTAERLLSPSTFPIHHRYPSMAQTPTSRKHRKNSSAYKKLVDFRKQSTHSTSRKKKAAANRNGNGHAMIS